MQETEQRPINIFNLSFGKDSMATLILAAEQGIPIDHVMYCDIKFDDGISGEHPLMAEWIPTAEKRLKELFGITVEHTSHKTYIDEFTTVTSRGKNKGLLRGFPYINRAWCNGELKVRAISKYLRQFEDTSIIQFVGIAADEPKRWQRMKNKETPRIRYRSLLTEQGVTESVAEDICRAHNLLSPVYSTNKTRGGCWFCPKQTLPDLYDIWENHSVLWKRLIALEKLSPRHPSNTFKPAGVTLKSLEERFKNGYIPKRKNKS